MSISEIKRALLLEADLHRALLRGESASIGGRLRRMRDNWRKGGRLANPWLIGAAVVAAITAVSRWPAPAALIRAVLRTRDR